MKQLGNAPGPQSKSQKHLNDRLRSIGSRQSPFASIFYLLFMCNLELAFQLHWRATLLVPCQGTVFVNPIKDLLAVEFVVHMQLHLQQFVVQKLQCKSIDSRRAKRRRVLLSAQTFSNGRQDIIPHRAQN